MKAGARLVGLGVLVAVLFLLSIALGGSVLIPVPEVLRALFAGPNAEGQNAWILWNLRMPSSIACVFIGGSLALVGSAFQALFRNPLADPFIVGVASGAAFGGSLAIVLGAGAALGVFLLPAFGFLFGLLALALVFALSRRQGRVLTQNLLLAGSVTGSLLAALQSMTLLLAGQDSNKVLRWLLGSMHPVFWPQIALLAIGFGIGAILLLRQAKALNALALGEDAARRLGVDTRTLRRLILGVGTALVSICVGTVGIIGFVGLAAPHIGRRLVGVDWRRSMLASMFIGSSMLLLADGIGQHLATVGEMPVGVVTALMGAPFLLALLRRAEV